jgi:hypothetical protein
MNAGPILILSYEIRKSKEKTQYVHNLNVKKLYYKNMITIEQNHNKDMLSKLVLNRLKVI